MLLYQPAGPACPEELSRLGSLQYINNRLPAATYFENTYFFNVSNEAITKSLGPASADYQRSLELLGSNAGQARYFFNSTMLEDNIATPAVYKVENPADSLYYGSSLDIYLQKHLLTFSEEFIGQLSAVPALQRNLLYERRTLGAETLALFPSSATDSFCMINVLRAMPRLDFLPHHCLFPGSSGNNSVFSIPVTWCLAGTGEAASCGYIQADTTVLLGSTPRQLFPIYDLLRPYLIIRKEYNLENLYRGTCEVTGNLVTGIYDHLPYTDTLAFTISLVPPLHYKKAGHAEVVLDNETLLAKAAAYFSGQSVTQGQVLERLQQGEFRSKLIVILLIAIAVLIIIYYYYFRKKKKG
ncbi:MAG: hypothetical protein P0Y53_19235 [Candidatus Pseudobacter hemicellulosilyticus]|uniref:Uncharacterized protein n=1 Tax=Candidatus Pseudobacter hemicellulosilyticus TaxID=3121375 RepID=A0AAJ6BGY4_9BACT|nr:MAG: hypothetical protein P0Y53_19235 [Pseudobacter sp.]